MNEKPTYESQIKELTKKLESPRITLLQIRSLDSELKKLIGHIRMVIQQKIQTNKELTKEEKEEIEAVNKAYKEFEEKYDSKVFSFVDKWEVGEFNPNDQELEFLQTLLRDIWNNKAGLREAKEDEGYQKDTNHTENVDKFEQDKVLSFSYHDKLLFLISQHYKEKSETSSSSSDQKKSPTILPWTLAIIFGITTIILAGLAGFLFYKQRKMKRFKV